MLDENYINQRLTQIECIPNLQTLTELMAENCRQRETIQQLIAKTLLLQEEISALKAEDKEKRGREIYDRFIKRFQQESSNNRVGS